MTQSRATAVYSTTPSSMRYSGTEVVTHSPFLPLLEEIRRRVQDRLGVEFGTCMLNRYEDGSVYIGCVLNGLLAVFVLTHHTDATLTHAIIASSHRSRSERRGRSS